MKPSICIIAFFCLIGLMPAVAQGGAQWTTTGSSGTVDESSMDFYAFSFTTAHYPSSTSITKPITLYYNVTYTSGTDAPAWSTLQIFYSDNSPYGYVQARLAQVNPLTGGDATISLCTSVDSTTNITCPITASMDFANYLYFVEVTLSRTTFTAKPMINGLRIY